MRRERLLVLSSSLWEVPRRVDGVAVVGSKVCWKAVVYSLLASRIASCNGKLLVFVNNKLVPYLILGAYDLGLSSCLVCSLYSMLHDAIASNYLSVTMMVTMMVTQ